MSDYVKVPKDVMPLFEMFMDRIMADEFNIDPDNDEQRKAAFARMAEEGEIRGGGAANKEHIAKLNAGGKKPIREFVNHVFGKDINGAIGPTHDGVRTIFAQGSKKGSFYKVGEVDLKTGKLIDIEKYGRQNTDDALKILDAYLK